MKKSFLVIALLISVNALANGFEPARSVTLTQARAAKAAVLPMVEAIPSFNGIGIGGCDVETGAPHAGGVYCVTVRVSDAKALRHVRGLFGGTAFVLQSGVWVSFEQRGAVVPQPAIGIHN